MILDDKTFIRINDVEKDQVELVKNTLLLLMDNGWEIRGGDKKTIILIPKTE